MRYAPFFWVRTTTKWDYTLFWVHTTTKWDMHSFFAFARRLNGITLFFEFTRRLNEICMVLFNPHVPTLFEFARRLNAVQSWDKRHSPNRRALGSAASAHNLTLRVRGVSNEPRGVRRQPQEFAQRDHINIFARRLNEICTLFLSSHDD